MYSIPDFTDRYHLPAGEHQCSMSEIETRFVTTDKRKKVWSQFNVMLKRLYELNLVPESLLINGSFVTGREEPGDVDFAALIPPEVINKAIEIADEEDKLGICHFLNPENQMALRGLFGSHLLVADSPVMLDNWGKIFKFGINGKLRERDPERDPDWVVIPQEKGILKVDKSDIIKYIGGESDDD